jgi:hypothetical protein
MSNAGIKRIAKNKPGRLNGVLLALRHCLNRNH